VFDQRHEYEMLQHVGVVAGVVTMAVAQHESGSFAELGCVDANRSFRACNRGTHGVAAAQIETAFVAVDFYAHEPNLRCAAAIVRTFLHLVVFARLDTCGHSLANPAIMWRAEE
jgi:hypothetical protein